MKRLEHYDLVNAADTAADLAAAILEISEDGLIQGRERTFDAVKMSSYVEDVIKGDVFPNVLTREFGIRQQALYIKYYTDRGKQTWQE